MNRFSRRRVLTVAGSFAAANALSDLSFAKAKAKPSGMLHSFRPGDVWLDTSGKPIQAHGGSIIVVNDTFYWYGENKERTVGDGKIWSWGIRAYSSKDLYNWDDLGTIIPPNTKDLSSPLNPGRMLDRPHIIFNPRTKKFVCWFKVMERNGTQTRSVMVANKITGPYAMVHTGILPLGMSAGDFDLVVTPDDHKAYMYFERVHSELICADLTDDFTNFTGYYSTHFPHRGPSAVREGPAYFWRKGKHYLATSGTTSYFPNPSEIALAETYHGPWIVLGDLHPSDRTRTSFNSQICSVFKHPGKQDLYIALADRWMGPLSGAQFESGELSRLVQSAFDKTFTTHEKLTSEETEAMAFNWRPLATSQSRYVWLPIRFDGGKPVIEWRDEWNLDEFA